MQRRSYRVMGVVVAIAMLVVSAPQANAQCAYTVLLSDSNSYSNPTPVYGFDGTSWTTLAGLPAANTTQLTSDAAGNFYALPEDGNIYRYNCSADTWDLVMAGPAAAVGRMNISMLDTNNGCYYWGKDETTTLYWTCTGTWASITTTATISSASDVDRAGDLLYIRTYGERGHHAYDISGGAPTPDHACSDATAVGENSRAGAFANGSFWTRTGSGQWVGLNASCVQTLGATPVGNHASSATDGAGNIYSVGYSPATVFERFDIGANTMTALPAAPGTDHSTIAVAAEQAEEPPPDPIPALSGGGAAFLALLVAAAGTVVLRRRL